MQGRRIYIKGVTVRFGFDVSESRKFDCLSKTKQRERLMVVYYIHSILALVFSGVNIDVIYTFTWGFHRCSFRQTGQCESLDTWNEQQNWLHVFFIYICNNHNC